MTHIMWCERFNFKFYEFGILKCHFTAYYAAKTSVVNNCQARKNHFFEIFYRRLNSRFDGWKTKISDFWNLTELPRYGAIFYVWNWLVRPLGINADYNMCFDTWKRRVNPTDLETTVYSSRKSASCIWYVQWTWKRLLIRQIWSFFHA